MPDSSNRLLSSIAVKPHTNSPSTSNPGPRYGPKTVVKRFAGSSRSATRTRTTRSTSPAVDDADRARGRGHHASTGVTAFWLGVRKMSGNVASTSTPAGSRPTSSSASRSAAATDPSSSGSTRPPGNETWPGCERRVCAPLGEHDVLAAGGIRPEEHEHRGTTLVVLGRRIRREPLVVGDVGAGGQGGEPPGCRGRHDATAGQLAASPLGVGVVGQRPRRRHGLHRAGRELVGEQRRAAVGSVSPSP